SCVYRGPTPICPGANATLLIRPQCLAVTTTSPFVRPRIPLLFTTVAVHCAGLWPLSPVITPTIGVCSGDVTGAIAATPAAQFEIERPSGLDIETETV